jgi:hypothetical protein
MLETPRNLLPVLLAVFIGGCTAGVGTRFVRPEPESLKNGQTKYGQIIERFGIPFRKGTVVKNEKTVEQIFYFYASAGGAAVRTLGFYFLNDVLVGHEFGSSWPEDHTDFDDSKVGQIAKGKSTRSEVLAFFGRPGGFYIYPMIKTQSGEAGVYLMYSQVYRNVVPPPKSLIVTFDSSGIVTELYSASRVLFIHIP